MAGFNQLGCSVSPEQKSLLQSHNFNLRPLGTVGHLDLWRLFLLTWHPIVAYAFSALILIAADFRYAHEQLDALIYSIGVAALLIYPTIALGVLIVGIMATKMYSHIRWSAVVYWTWWPFFQLLMCCLAVLLGSALGHYLWQHHFFPHAQLQRLQAYQHVDPRIASGLRLQDAGVVLFNDTAGVDRLRTGCIKDGVTYCVAPIVLGGQVPAPGQAAAQLAGQERASDLFMVGTDCCACPGEFRCGDWNKLAPLGGMRVVDSNDRHFFKLAAEDWSSTYGRPVQHPIFFRWVAEPLAAYHELEYKGQRLLALGLLLGPSLLLLLAAGLNGLLGLLVDGGLAAPVETPVPPRGLGRRLGAHFLPHGHRQQLEAEEQQLRSGMPADPKYVCL